MSVNDGVGHRQRQAELTKQQIARAARALFAEHGFLATTITSISREADIPVQTIYSAFGSKAGILEKITETWMAESRTITLATASLRESDPAKKLHLLAEINFRQLKVGRDVIAIYEDAARSDAHMAATLRSVLAAREREIRKLLRSLGDQLRAGLTGDQALDIALALTLPNIFETLVVERGWTGKRYQAWLGSLLVDQLLEP